MVKTTSQFSYEKTASVLAETEYSDDTSVSKRWGISERTIKRWRAKALLDEKLSLLVNQKKALLAQSWQEDASKCMKIALTKLTELIKHDGDPKQIHAIAGAIKIVGELKLGYEVLTTDESSNNQ